MPKSQTGRHLNGRSRVGRRVHGQGQVKLGIVKLVLRLPWAAPQRNGEIEMQKALFAAIVATSNDAIMSDTLDGIFTSWNPAAERIYGYTADEMIGQPFSILIPSEKVDEAADILGKIRKGQPITNYETMRLRKDGSAFPVSVTISPIHDLTGALVGASVITRDMTELKKFEARNAVLAAIVTSSNDAITSYTSDGIITSWNPGAERMFGYSTEEMIGQPVSVRFPPEKAHEAASIRERLMRGETIVNFETVRLRKDGSAIPVSMNISPIYDLTGTAIGASTITRDITELKKFETRNAVLAAIVASSNNAILSFTYDGIATSWNPSAERIFGYSADEVIGQPYLVFVPSEKADESADLQEKIREGKTILNYETVRRRKDGSAFPVSMNISPIYDLTGAVIGASAIYRDMTELKKSESEKALLAAIVEYSNDAISSFTYDGIIASWNPAAERLYGYSPEEIFGQPFSILIPSERAAEAAHILGKTRKGKTIINYETVRRRKDGSGIPVSLTFSPIYDLTGTVIGGSAIHRDMTELKRAEQKFHTIVESAPDALVIVDKTGTITIVNSQTEEIFGYRRDEMLGQRVELLIPSRFHAKHPDFRDGYFAHPRIRPMGSVGGGR